MPLGRTPSEIALDYRTNDIDDSTVSGDVSALAGMVNGYFQLPIDFPVKPYIGAGIGVANVSAEAKAFGTKFVDDDDTVYATLTRADTTLAPRSRSWRRLWAPLVYNVEQDPREEVEITLDNLWLLQPVVRKIYEFLVTVDQEGLIFPGGDAPQEATVEIPFQSQEEIERSMSAIKWKMMKKKIKELIPIGRE